MRTLRKIAPYMIVALVAVVSGVYFWGGGEGDHGEGGSCCPHGSGEAVAEMEWTCSMHPQIRQPRQGRCPLCDMDLIPVSGDDDPPGVPILRLSESAAVLAGVETSVARRRFTSVEVRLTGKVAYNEIAMAHITARFPGRIDKLFVNFTGMAVAKGDRVAEVYSPDLLVAQQEVLQALKLQKQDPSPSGLGERTMGSVREKFRYWGFPTTEVDEIIARGEIVQRLTIRAPISGIVVEKNTVEGRYFNTGDILFSISDLATVWVNLEAFEMDIPWLKYGQEVRFETDAAPGRVYKGRVAFIQPFLDESTRTVRVRLNAENLDGTLRPGTFVRAALRANFADDGTMIEPSLAGKWISPMHPEIIKDEPGNCDICGIDLVRAEDLGMAVSETSLEPPLLIPATAPLLAGRRALVYVETEKGVYEGREVRLGPRAGDFYVVKEGLEEGDVVVSRGAFKIDSSLQLLARPGLMSVAGDDEDGRDAAQATSGPHSVPANFANAVQELYKMYFSVQRSLAADEFEDSRKNAGKLVETLAGIDGALLDAYAREDWTPLERRIHASASRIRDASTVEDARTVFQPLSAAVETLVLRFGSAMKIYKMHCPMAFDDKGADWLQDNETLVNPYYGAVMLRCGVKKADLGGNR